MSFHKERYMMRTSFHHMPHNSLLLNTVGVARSYASCFFRHSRAFVRFWLEIFKVLLGAATTYSHGYITSTCGGFFAVAASARSRRLNLPRAFKTLYTERDDTARSRQGRQASERVSVRASKQAEKEELSTLLEKDEVKRHEKYSWCWWEPCWKKHHSRCGCEDRPN